MAEITEQHALRLLNKHDPQNRLMPWQRHMAKVLMTGVPVSSLVDRGRRAGWTTLLQVVEECLKDRYSSRLTLWDGKRYDRWGSQLDGDKDA